MRRLIGISILALSLALSSAAHADAPVFRMQMDAPIFYNGAPDLGGNAPIEFIVDGATGATSIDGRDLGSLNIPISVTGIDSNHAVGIADLPPGATWSGSAILWSPAASGTYTPTIEVRDAANC